MRRLLAAFILLASSVLAAEPGVYSPNTYKGETFTRIATWRDANGDLVDLTGYVAKLTISAAPVGSTNPVLTLSSGDGLTLGGGAGTIEWEMTPARTNALPVGALPYDLKLTDSTGVVTYLLTGKVYVRPTVTH
jgi:hypothetical protein